MPKTAVNPTTSKQFTHEVTAPAVAIEKVFNDNIKTLTVNSTVDIWIAKTEAAVNTAPSGELNGRIPINANTVLEIEWGHDRVWIKPRAVVIDISVVGEQ